METINLDFNNLFNLSYNFEGLKFLLTSFSKNQNAMQEKIKELEKRLNDYRLQISQQNRDQNNNDLANAILSSQEENKENNEKKTKSNMLEADSYDYKENKENKMLVNELEDRIYRMEQQFKELRVFIPVFNQDRSLNDILEENNSNIFDISESVKELSSNYKNLKETVEQINLKVGDFSVYDIFKDVQITGGGDIDASKILIQALEKKVFDKFKFQEDKIKKDEEILLKVRGDLTNLKNSYNFENRNLNYLKQQITQVPNDMEIIRKNLTESINKNNELMDKLKEKTNNNIKDINSKINDVKKEIKNLENMQLKKNESPKKDRRDSIKEPEEKPALANLDDYLDFKENIQKKYFNLEKKILSMSSNIKPEDLAKEINELKIIISSKKPTQQDFYNLNEHVQALNGLIDSMKDDNDSLQTDFKKMRENVSSINKKCENIYLQSINQNKNGEDTEETKLINRNFLLSKLEDYVEITEFHEFIKEQSKFGEKMRKEFETCKQFYEEVIDTLKKAASVQDLKNLEDYLVDLLNEFKDKTSKSFPKRSEVNKNFKALELQIKQVYELVIKKDENKENWMLAKKPLGGFSCASCESYIGDLKENDEKVFWNQMPDHEKETNVNRIGNGFSRILNMVNISRENDNKKIKNDNFFFRNEMQKTDYGRGFGRDIKTFVNQDMNNNFEGFDVKTERNIFNETCRINKNIFKNVNTNSVENNTEDKYKCTTETNTDFKDNKQDNKILPPITSSSKPEEQNKIYEEGKEEKEGPKVMKIIRKKK